MPCKPPSPEIDVIRSIISIGGAGSWARGLKVGDGHGEGLAEALAEATGAGLMLGALEGDGEDDDDASALEDDEGEEGLDLGE